MTVRYRISYDDSADKYTARRFTVEISEKALAREIVRLQASGRVIFKVVRADA